MERGCVMRLSNVVFSLRCLFMGAALLCSQDGFSEFVGPPNTSAGIVEKQIEREYQDQNVTPTREVPLLEVEIPEEQLMMGDDETAFIQKITLEGNDIFSKKVIRKILAGYEGKELKMRDIKELCLKLQEKYVSAGYFLARVYPPEQEVKEGNLTLEVLEGRLGNVTVEGNKYYKEAYIKKFFTKFQGKAINYDAFLKSLFLLNEKTDLNVGAVFKKGSEVGTADLILRVDDKRPCHLYVDENNYGSHQTSIWRTGAQFQYGNLITGGDKFAVTEVVGNPVSHLNYTNASYTIPLNTIGTEMKLNYLYSSFHVPLFPELRLRGRSQIGTVEFSQALLRSRRMSTDVYLSFDYKQIANYQRGNINSYDKLRIFNLGFDLDYSDSFKGRNVADISISYGVPHFLGGLHTVDDLCSRSGAGGLFAILNVDYTRIQTLPKDCFINLHIAGQATPYKLPISEQLYIGGVDSVRGFPIAAALGDDGYYANLEFRAALPFIRDTKVPFFKQRKWKEFLQLVGFVDQGGVKLNGGGEHQSHHISMTGAGAGIRIFAPYVNFTFDVAFPLTGDKKQSSPVYYFKAGVQPF